MSKTCSQSSQQVVLCGLIALAVAMGIGRFAFTPLLPLMMRDGTLDAGTGAVWAAANYAGYLLGALSAAWFAGRPRTGLQWGLLAVVISTLGMAAIQTDGSWLGGLLRATAGVGSAWVLVCASSWCLPELARRQATALGGWIYTGVGTGIALTGLWAWLGGRQSAAWLWIELGGLALGGAWWVLRRLSATSVTEQQVAATAANVASTVPHATRATGLIICYGAFGFGYIVPATFLPTMARALVDDPLIFGLTWPIFGAAAALSVAMVSRWLSSWPRRKVWACAQAIMGVGTCIPLLQQSLWALAVSAILVGGTFMVATMAGLQLAREKMPTHPTPLLSRMTVGFALGQIAGPLGVRLLGTLQVSPPEALAYASTMATLVLFITAAWLWRDVA